MLLLLASCKTADRSEPFDPGILVHFIVHASPAPKEPLAVAPVCGVDAETVRSVRREIAPGGPRAVEVAVLRVKEGERDVAIFDPLTGARAEKRLALHHDHWIVLEIDPASRSSRLGVFESPPRQEIGAWVPWARVAD